MTDLNEETFDFLAVVTGEALPEGTVTINPAEALAYRIREIEESIANVPNKREVVTNSEGVKESITLPDIEVLQELQNSLDEAKATIAKYDLTFKIKAIPSDMIESIIKKVKSTHKPKYEKHPITGLPIEQPSQDANQLMEDLYNHACIQTVTNADGKERTISLEEFIQARKTLPESQYGKLKEAISKLTVEARFFESSIDENF